MPASKSSCPVAHGPVRDFPFTPVDGLVIEPVLAELRREEPISRIRLPYGGEAWLATRYQDVRNALADPRLSRAAVVNADVPRRQEMQVGPEGIMYMDPPDHSRLRRLLTKAFTRRRVETLRPRVAEIAAELAGDLAAQGSGGDLVSTFSWPLPTRVICELLGVPYEDREIFSRGADALMQGDTLPHAEFTSRINELCLYLAKLIAQRRAQPTEDMLTALIQARDEDDRLSEQELISISVVLLAGGHETTANQITNFLYTLLRHPGQLALLREKPELMPQAVDELMRYIPLGTGHHAAMIATEDLEIGGQRIAEGESVYVHIHSANRDGEFFENPDELDLGREDNHHMGFGHGVHFCVGAQLARMELSVAVESVLDRFPTLELDIEDEAIRWRSSLLVRGPLALPVRW
ncbi:cytochrome P450 [Streptomyces physcomitrii]|uniref:Cytochrome P450 n=1 Tax=Streptomyces physcomitrii TaxID=2724184 RepID=A0ABX1H723_9ACTN|nr:cytochrome P450 [Streptomyces physcomitrii]NKI43882.1 cytochrome P450 [Streptomyces physcomitrii]